jgi:hypothetical protein
MKLVMYAPCDEFCPSSPVQIVNYRSDIPRSDEVKIECKKVKSEYLNHITVQ